MADELNQLRKPAVWLFLNRLVWFWSLLAWAFLGVSVTIKRATWLPPVNGVGNGVNGELVYYWRLPTLRKTIDAIATVIT